MSNFIASNGLSIKKGVRGCIEWVEKDWDTIKEYPREYIHKI